MGCDIHVFVEFRQRDGANDPWTKMWRNFGGKFYVGRDYAIFNRLAGVRGYGEKGPIVDHQPFPDDVDYVTRAEYYLTVVEDDKFEKSEEDGCRYVKKSQAEKWVKDGYSKYHPTDPTKISGPDWHNAGCVDLKNWRKATHQKGYPNLRCDAVYAMCKEMEKQGHETRIVFWFDN